MTSDPWLTIVGLGEDGASGLSSASRDALDRAELVFGGARHLALAGIGAARGRTWPVPFDVAGVLAARPARTVVLASGDPFWFGVGSILAERLNPRDWRAHPAPSTLALAAARLGWRVEAIRALGLHASPFETAIPHLRRGARLLVLIRDAAAAARFLAFLTARGYGRSVVHVLEALGGPRERIRAMIAVDAVPNDVAAPLSLAIAVEGAAGLSAVAGRPDDLFETDGQITKAPIRALTLAALAPRPGEHLWDLGAGSGSVAIEWLLAGGRATAVELRPDRAEMARRNLAAFGLSGSAIVIDSRSEEALDALERPDAVFLGGGANADLIARIVARLPRGGRLVANAVTIETEALLVGMSARHGGRLIRIDLAEAAPLGRFRGWRPARPIVQWSLTR
ncbi:precorrin-6y C5,15-methyltransferase (decarboxylating) subunit CbiE [Methylosinus sp. Sm6]|nr:precorrin-6y C5,15-methyltransferase (decarboxylating) subunit CbiE [Methylosinus sp. Sm6]MBY6241070.1 precorrin-6y C5,15-methyltransferase (decarboxylating) subunit CbiE [Methylosinus sp. Sm6]